MCGLPKDYPSYKRNTTFGIQLEDDEHHVGGDRYSHEKLCRDSDVLNTRVKSELYPYPESQ